MPTPALLLLIATLIPLGVFALLAGIGRRLGEPLAGVLATLASAASFGCSIFSLMAWLAGGVQDGRVWGAGKLPILQLTPWISGVGSGPGAWLDAGIYLDSLTVILFFMITAVSAIVHIFSIGYLRGDARFARFFALLGLFMFSMLALVISATLLQIFVFWEMVGLCSYLLIGFWFEKKSATNAATKAFVMNRIGDAAFIAGIGLLFMTLGNVTLPQLWQTLGTAHVTALSPTMLTLSGLLLFCGAVGKSAQFPLHTWLPDAMEGPTPVSALIHAATMVAAGVYLVGRIYPILTPDAKLVIAVVGCITMLLGALIALVQTDIKRVLAYSTISQLGLMMLGMGVGSWVGALFHLLTHGFFKALLFLGAGSVIDAAHHEQDMRKFGGLFTRIPVTAVTFLIGVLAISGVPYFAGYLSKETILAHAGAFASSSVAGGSSPLVWVFFIAPSIVAYLTAFYMMRCWSLTFLGRPRDRDVADQASELPIMWLPLCGLAVFAIIAGYSWSPVRELTEKTLVEIRAGAPSDFTGFNDAWPVESYAQADVAPDGGEPAVGAPAVVTPMQQAHARGVELAHTWTGWAFAVGIMSAGLLYGFGMRPAAGLLRFAPVRWAHHFLVRKMYIDELYDVIFFRTFRSLAAIGAFVDRHVLDNLVNGSANVVRRLSDVIGWNDRTIVDGAVDRVTDLVWAVGDVLRSPQTGRVRLYVTVLMVAVTVGLSAVVLVVWTR